jgi:hypothetical protein
VPGRFREVRIEAVPARVRTIPMPIRTALDRIAPNTVPLTVALAEAAVTEVIAEADRADLDVIAAKTVSAPRKWERLKPFRASCFLRAVLAR